MEIDIKQKMDVLMEHALKGDMNEIGYAMNMPDFASFRLTNRKPISGNSSQYINIAHVMDKNLPVHEATIILSMLYAKAPKTLRKHIKEALESYEQQKLLNCHIVNNNHVTQLNINF